MTLDENSTVLSIDDRLGTGCRLSHLENLATQVPLMAAGRQSQYVGDNQFGGLCFTGPTFARNNADLSRVGKPDEHLSQSTFTT